MSRAWGISTKIWAPITQLTAVTVLLRLVPLISVGMGPRRAFNGNAECGHLATSRERFASLAHTGPGSPSLRLAVLLGGLIGGWGGRGTDCR